MQTVRVMNWVLAVEPAETARLQATRERGSPEECACLHCRNFSAARETAYPQPFRELLNQLGIPHDRESEMWHGGESEPGLHFYAGWFHFVGHVVSGPEAHQAGPQGGPVELAAISESFSLGFTRNIALVPVEFGDIEVGQLEFSTHVPWVLQETFVG